MIFPLLFPPAAAYSRCSLRDCNSIPENITRVPVFVGFSGVAAIRTVFR
jgi:hypothetical protein